MTDKAYILEMLAGGDRRSIGRVDEVVAEVLNDRGLLAVLFDGMLSDDPIIRMRSADAAEKVTALHSEYLQPFKTTLLQQVAQVDQQEVRWHVAQMVPRLDMTAEERDMVVEMLIQFLGDKSRIVQTFSMQALADLAEENPMLGSRVIPLIDKLIETGSPAVRTRGLKLKAKLGLSTELPEPQDREGGKRGSK